MEEHSASAKRNANDVILGISQYFQSTAKEGASSHPIECVLLGAQQFAKEHLWFVFFGIFVMHIPTSAFGLARPGETLCWLTRKSLKWKAVWFWWIVFRKRTLMSSISKNIRGYFAGQSPVLYCYSAWNSRSTNSHMSRIDITKSAWPILLLIATILLCALHLPSLVPIKVEEAHNIIASYNCLRFLVFSLSMPCRLTSSLEKIRNLANDISMDLHFRRRCHPRLHESRTAGVSIWPHANLHLGRWLTTKKTWNMMETCIAGHYL